MSIKSEVENEQLRMAVLNLLLQNKTQRQIGRELDISQSSVSKYIKLIREEWKERRAVSYEAHVDAELRRLSEVENAMWERVLSGTDDWAVDRWLQLFRERAKILGLYAPEKKQVITSTLLEDEIQKLEEELGATALKDELLGLPDGGS